MYKINSVGLPYESLTIKYLVNDGISLGHEMSSIALGHICDQTLSTMKFCIDDGNLEIVLIDVDVKDNAYLLLEEKIATLLEISQDIAQDIHNLTKEVTLIKKHMLGKEILNDDNNN